METLRQPMIRARIHDIVNGRFVRKKGLEPSYVLTEGGKRISRACLLGTVIDKFISEDGNYSTITLDDDSDSIRVKAFGKDVTMLDNLQVGDLVMVVGKVREYADENYIIPEVIKKVENPNFECFHRLEVLKQLLQQKRTAEIVRRERERFSDPEELKEHLKKEYGVEPEAVESILETLEGKEETEEKDYKPLVLETLDRLDEGQGVEFKKLFEASGLPESLFEEVVNELLTEGVCYEPKPGVIKRV